MAKNKYAVPKTAITEKGLKRLMKDAAKKHASVSEWAKSHEITPQAVSAFLRKTQGAGLQIPEALGYRPQIVFLPLDEELIAHMNPPRKTAQKPTKKVDHTREPIDRSSRRPVNEREETRKRLKNRNR
jgi:hypothetical protein